MPTDLAAIEARLDPLPEQPWQEWKGRGGVVLDALGLQVLMASGHGRDDMTAAEVQAAITIFAVHAPTDLRALIADLRAAEERETKLQHDLKIQRACLYDTASRFGALFDAWHDGKSNEEVAERCRAILHDWERWKTEHGIDSRETRLRTALEQIVADCDECDDDFIEICPPYSAEAFTGAGDPIYEDVPCPRCSVARAALKEDK